MYLAWIGGSHMRQCVLLEFLDQGEHAKRSPTSFSSISFLCARMRPAGVVWTVGQRNIPGRDFAERGPSAGRGPNHVQEVQGLSYIHQGSVRPVRYGRHGTLLCEQNEVGLGFESPGNSHTRSMSLTSKMWNHLPPLIGSMFKHLICSRLNALDSI